MKKVVLVVFVLGCFFQSFSQEEKTKSKSFFGAKVGFNVIKTNENDDKPYSFGFQIGATFTTPISKCFAFQPEILFQTTNSSSQNKNFYSNAISVQERTTKNTLLIVPLDFKYSISKKVNIDLGPSLVYRLNYKSKVVETTTFNTGEVNVIEIDFSNNSSINDLNFAANLGVNYNITEKIYTGLRYTLFVYEFQDIDNAIEDSLFALSLGYSFK